MRFTLPLPVLSKLLSRAQKVAAHGDLPFPPKSLRLEVEANTLTATICDPGGGEVWLSQREPLELGAESGVAFVPIPTLQKATKGGGARDSVIVETGGGAEGVERFVAVTVGDFAPLRCGVAPAALTDEAQPTAAPTMPLRALMGTADLLRGLGAVSCSISADKGRPNLTGAYATVRGGKLRLVTTDGHRLSQWHGDAIGDDGEVGIIPAFVVKAVSALSAEGDPAEVFSDGKHVAIRCGTVTYTSRLINGTFPNFEAVIPVEKRERRWSVDRLGLLKQLKRAKELASTKTYNLVLGVDSAGLGLSWRDSEGVDFATFVTLLSTPSDGRAYKAGFNVCYLIDALESFSGDTIEAEIIDTLEPTTLRSPEDPGLFHIVMPMRI